MSEAVGGGVALPGWWADEQYCYLTTRGRRTGRAHEIEIWFGLHQGCVYMISGRGERADWVRNLRAAPEVEIRVGGERPPGGGHPCVTSAYRTAKRAGDKRARYRPRPNAARRTGRQNSTEGEL